MSDSLQGKLKEQAYLAQVLEMWVEVKKQGVEPESVATLGFDPSLLSAAERNDLRRRYRGDSFNPFNWPLSYSDGSRCIRPRLFNFVRLRSGEISKLSPMVARPDEER